MSENYVNKFNEAEVNAWFANLNPVDPAESATIRDELLDLASEEFGSSRGRRRPYAARRIIARPEIPTPILEAVLQELPEPTKVAVHILGGRDAEKHLFDELAQKAGLEKGLFLEQYTGLVDFIIPGATKKDILGLLGRKGDETHRIEDDEVFTILAHADFELAPDSTVRLTSFGLNVAFKGALLPQEINDFLPKVPQVVKVQISNSSNFS